MKRARTKIVRAKRSPKRDQGMGEIPMPLVWGALGVAVIAPIVYFWPERQVRMV